MQIFNTKLRFLLFSLLTFIIFFSSSAFVLEEDGVKNTLKPSKSLYDSFIGTNEVHLKAITTSGSSVSADIPHITGIDTVNKSTFVIKFTTDENATGYYLYDADETGNKSLIKVIKRANVSSYTYKDAEYGSKHNFIIQAYKTINGFTSFGQLSEAFSYKFKVKKKYKNGYAYYLDSYGNPVADVLDFLKKSVYYKIDVNLSRCTLTILAKDNKKGYTIPVKVWLCSPGNNTIQGNYSLGAKFRRRVLFYDSYSQWSANIYGNFLLHTVPYKSYSKNDDLDVDEYNKLGTRASHGCVRLQCVAAKWINDNCPEGTPIHLYKSPKEGPLKKPKLEKLPAWHTWDPTDPTAKKLCKENDCHHIKY